MARIGISPAKSSRKHRAPEPYLNLGLEPSTTPYDSVSEAIDNDAVIWLNSGASREWSVSVELAS